MKIRLIFLFTLLTILCQAQLQDLAQLADGDIIYSSMLYDTDSKIYGYLYIFRRDVNKETYKMEYVFLDKNLNKVSNSTFTSNAYNSSVISEYYDCTLMGENIILNKLYLYKPFMSQGGFSPLVTAFQMINLKENTVSKEFEYDQGRFTELPAEFRDIKKENKKVVTKNSVLAFDNGEQSGFFILQHNTKGQDFLEKDIQLYNANRELQWKYLFNPSGIMNNYTSFNFLSIKNNTIYGLQAKRTGYYATEYKIVALDFETGKKKYEYVFENLKSQYSHTLHVKEVNGKLILTGNFSSFNKYKEFELTGNLGFYRIVLDEKGKELENKHVKWDKFLSQIEVDKKGRVERNYMLRPIRFLIFNDESISVITEKYSEASTFSSEKTTDFVIFNMDSTFTLTKINTIKKDLTKFNSSDYLFSQYIDNESGAIFFYSNEVKDDKTKEKSVILGIAQLKDGKILEEKIPIFSKNKYAIEPLPAKEGYIMLREYNEKDKYNQVRLERINL